MVTRSLFASLLGWAVFALMSAAEPVELALNLSEGTTYWRKHTADQLTRSRVSDDSMALHQMNSETFTLAVTRVGDDGVITGDMTFVAVTAEHRRGAEQQSYDSRTDPPQQGANLTPFAFFLDRPVMVQIQPDGTIAAVQALDNVPAAQAKEMTATIKRFLERALAYLPPGPLESGDTWKSEETLQGGPMPVAIEVANTLSDVTADDVRIETETLVNVDKDNLPEEVPLDSFTGMVATTVIADRGSGWVREGTYVQQLEGEGRIVNPETGDESILTVTTTSEGQIEGGTGAPPMEDRDAL